MGGDKSLYHSLTPKKAKERRKVVISPVINNWALRCEAPKSYATSDHNHAGGPMRLRFELISLLTAALIGTGCGQQSCRLSGLSVGPPNATADHAAPAPGNQVQFFATATVPKGCTHTACVNCSGQTWTVSDSVDVSISNNVNDNGTAVCKGTTNGAATVTATAPAGTGSTKTVSGTATLICK